MLGRARCPVRASSGALVRIGGGGLGAGVGLGFRLGLGLGLLLQQRLPVGYRDLIVVGMDFAEGQEAVAVAAVVDECGLQRRLDPRDLCQIDVAAKQFACGGLVVELLYPAVAKHHDPSFLRVRGVNEHLVLIVHVMGSLAPGWAARGRPRARPGGAALRCIAPMMVAFAGPRRLKARLSGSCKAVGSAMPRGRTVGLRCAVAVHARLPNCRHDPSVFGHGRRGRSCPSSDARVSGKPCESISGDPHAVTPRSQPQGTNPQLRLGSMIETAIRLRSVRPVGKTIALRSYQKNQRSGAGRALTVACATGGELVLRAWCTPW